tara:strand:- start:1280 stop:1570 length:291 start_codon:yes stop_codon:yes gene_type:complete
MEEEKTSCDKCDSLVIWGDFEKSIEDNNMWICSDCQDEENAPKCSQCGDKLGETYWTCWGNCQYSSENMVCGKGDCWRDWIQINMQEYNTSDNSEA